MSEAINLGELSKLMDEAHEAERKLNELIKEKGQSILVNLFKWLFDNSDIVKVRWTQYTPYFNDGEECVFRLRDPFFLPKGVSETGDDFDWYNFESSNFNRSSRCYTREDKYKEEVPEYATEHNYAAVKAFEGHYWKLKDVLKRVFGDHVEITVSRLQDGSIEFQTEEYEHE